jgi:hypothetical protein
MDLVVSPQDEPFLKDAVMLPPPYFVFSGPRYQDTCIIEIVSSV